MQPVSQISDRVSEQLLSNCCRGTARSAFPLALSTLLTYLLLNGKVDSTQLHMWLIGTWVIIVSRVVLLRVVSKSENLQHKTKRLFATLLTLVLGFALAAALLLFFSSIDVFERTMLTAIMLGLCTPSASINMGYPPLLLAHIGPVLGTSSALWAINSGAHINPLFAIAVSISILILTHNIVRNGRFMFETFVLAIESSTKLEIQSERLSQALKHAETAQQAAETSSESKTRFIAAASHDLRQPVHVLNLFSGALRNAKLDERARDIVDNMGIAVNSLSSQLNSLLDISELDSGSVKPVFKDVDLWQLSHTLTTEMHKLAEDKGIDLLNEVPRQLFVKTDPVMLSQIIRNLCGNAIKYTHQGSVTILAVHNGDTVTLSIADTGVGIDNCDSGKVFEEFYQVGNHARDRNQGLGLGLSIVERLIKTLEHKLSLTSSVGHGTTVSITMQSSDMSNAMFDQLSLSSANERENPLAEGFWVHLVDDEESVQTGVRAFLETLGAKVTTSDTSVAAIDFLKQHDPDALLVDLHLRDGETGLKVVNAANAASVPIALITGRFIQETELAANYPDLLMLQKPVSNEALLELLEYMTSDNTEPVSETDSGRRSDVLDTAVEIDS